MSANERFTEPARRAGGETAAVPQPDATEETVAGRAAAQAPAERWAARWRAEANPSLDAFLADHPGLTAEELVAVVRVDQEERWRRGDHRPTEAYLQMDAVRARGDQVALDLIFAELLLRESLDARPAFDEYLVRFAQYEQPLRRLFQLYQTLTPGPGVKGISTGTGTGPGPAGESTPTQVGKYRIIEPLGAGGQAAVYRAVHPHLGNDVVLKLAHQAVGDAEVRARMTSEGRILAALDHPALARVHDLDFHEGRVFLVMEYVRGRPLDDAARQQKLTPRRAAELVAQVARALAEAHRRGVCHLDIKPRNIVLEDTGRPRLIDFGLARLQSAYTPEARPDNSISGTIAFMAPEQARGEGAKVGPRSDLFGLGGVLYFLLVGKAPYEGGSLSEALARASNGEWDEQALRASGAPRRLQAVCRRAMAFDPAKRYATADAMADDLERVVRRPRRAALVGAAIVALLLVAVGLVWVLGRGGQGDTQNPPPGPDGVKGAVRGAGPSSLAVRVFRDDRFFDLAHVAPLRDGDEAVIEAAVPSELHAALFLFTSEGKLELLRQRPAGGVAKFRYPEKDGEAAPVTGPAGTEVLLACGRRSAPLTLADLRALWGETQRWPELPGDSLLRVDEQGARIVQRGRGFGPPKGRADPEADVRRRLEALYTRLRQRCDSFVGLAFAQQRAKK